MIDQNIFANLPAALQAAGLMSFLQMPLAVDGAALMQDFTLGRIRLTAPQSAGTPAAPGELHPNDLRLLANGTTLAALQPVTGVVRNGVSPKQEADYGLFNTDRITRAAAAVAANPAISALVLNFDTPGGSVMGLQSAADSLLALKALRPDVAVIGYSSRLCASAGMYLAAAADQFHAAPGAYIGSIGTVAQLSSWAGFHEKLGIDSRTYTADSDLKSLGRGPITAAHDEHINSLVQQYSDEFKSWMSARRGLKPDAMRGQAWEARLAPAGMADSVGYTSLESLLAVILGV